MIEDLRASLLVTAFLLALAACASPEAERVRSGGVGADPGNRDAPVEMRPSAGVYHETPCRVSTGCTGPMPDSGS